MKKEKTFNIAITATPEKLEAEARDYWIHLFHQHQIETVAFGADLEKRFPALAGEINYDPFDYRAFITNMIKKQTHGHGYEYMTYERSVKPHLHWDKIKECFKGLGRREKGVFTLIDDEIVDFIVMLLKPWPFTTEFQTGDQNLERLVKSTCNEFNKARNEFSRPAGKIDKIQFPKHDLFPFGHLQAQCNYWMLLSEQIVMYGERIPNLHYRYFGIEGCYYRAPQEHSFWRCAAAGAVYNVYDFCHNNNCYFDGKLECNTKIHEQSYQIVADLLKILYPNIWTDNAATTARKVKSRALRLLSPDTFPAPVTSPAEAPKELAFAERMAKIAKIANIVEAIADLKKEDFTDSGMPRLDSLMKLCGFDIEASEREKAWAEFKVANPNWSPQEVN